jgi:hypothetical protein
MLKRKRPPQRRRLPNIGEEFDVWSRLLARLREPCGGYPISWPCHFTKGVQGPKTLAATPPAAPARTPDTAPNTTLTSAPDAETAVAPTTTPPGHNVAAS